MIECQSVQDEPAGVPAANASKNTPQQASHTWSTTPRCSGWGVFLEVLYTPASICFVTSVWKIAVNRERT